MTDILRHFHPLVRHWFADRFDAPTEVQVRAWSEIVGGGHVLVTAPTGSGKTLAAFLWAVNQLLSGIWAGGETRILYVSPLKALNNDVQRNLIAPLRELEKWFAAAGLEFPPLAVRTRSGDTPGSERQRMLRHPPEILITTPESLNILLTSAAGRHALTGLRTVILDEIHAVAGTKRGTHLITAVDRLVPICGEFQRIALSATVSPLEIIADFIGGFTGRGDSREKRRVSLVRAEQAKELRLEVRMPQETPGMLADDYWAQLAHEFRKIIDLHRSTLFFVNSRRNAERLTRLINESAGEDLAYAHHGSLSREIRLAVEDRLKRGELKAIVATNSLELGIDIGRLDSVVLVQSPRTISSAIQRIGRSGHGVGEVSRGLLYSSGGLDAVEAAVIARAVSERDLEPLRPVDAPLDLLAQVILSMTVPEEWDLDKLYEFLLTSYPYRNLPRRHFDLVVGMLEGRYVGARVPELRPRVSVDRPANTVRARSGTALHVYLDGGTIPDRGYFDLRLEESGAKIGELDEEFVWERRLGDTFSLGAQVWRIRDITHSSVIVSASRGSRQIIPFWRAEEMDRDFHYSEKLASFLEFCNDKLDDESFVSEISAGYAMDAAAAGELAAFLLRQKERTGTDLPHRHHLLVEQVESPPAGDGMRQIILHTLWGNRLNRPFTFAFAAAWESRYGHAPQVIYNNDAIAFLLPGEVEPRSLFSLVTPENIESLLRAELEKTGYFGARFRENAGRALLLSKMNLKKRMPLWLTRLRAKKLLGAVARFGDFPVVIETWRSCLQDEFDLPALKGLLEEIREGVIWVGETRTSVPSPFAAGLIWQQTNKFIYEDDTPGPQTGPAPARDLIGELVFTAGLRPRIPSGLIMNFEEKRRRTAAGYAPEPGRDLIDWVKERLIVPADEWSRLLDAVARDHGLDPTAVEAEIAGRIVGIALPGAPCPLYCAIEFLPEIAAGLGRSREEIAVLPLAGDRKVSQGVDRLTMRVFEPKPDASDEENGSAFDGEQAAVNLVGRWLSFYGPVDLDRIERTLAMGDNRLAETLHSLEEAGLIVIDRLREGSSDREVCDAANLESLLRILRRSQRPVFETLEIRCLPLFLAQFQGLARPGRSADGLRKRLEQLFGVPLAAGAWEEEVLPARMEEYAGAMLDSLLLTSDLSWFGCGEGRLTFSFPEDIGLFLEQEENIRSAESMTAARLLPDPNGRYSLPAIRAFAGFPPAEVDAELWRLAWQGRVSNDSFVPVRKGILSRFRHGKEEKREMRRPMRNRWRTDEGSVGNWYLLDVENPADDPLSAEETNRERVRVLLDRYGILFRELLFRELPPLQWQRLFRTLRIMELSGEVLTGSFFNGIPGLQFISHEAYRLLSGGLDEDAVYWLNAADPASLCGTGLEALKDELPPRIPSTHLVYHGTRLVLVSRRFGRELHILVDPGEPRLPDYFSLFNVLVSRGFNPRKRISVEFINGVSAAESAYAQALTEFGFVLSYQGLELWKKY